MGNSIGWFEIYVDDVERARAFYEAVFKVKLEKMKMPEEDEMIMLAFPSDYESYGAPGALVKMPGYSAGKRGVLVYFSCEDCSVEEERAAANGGKVEKPKESIGEYGFISMIIDTEGNLVGLHSMN